MSSLGRRWVGGFASLVAGGFLLSTVLVGMNEKVHKPDEVKSRTISAVNVEKKKAKPKKQPVKRPRPKPRRVRRSTAPRPNLASNLSGLGVGLPLFQVGDLSGLGDDLLSGQEFSKDMVLNEEAVDEPPSCVGGNPQPSYPARARSKGVEGYVVVRMLIAADGQVRKVSVLESEPEGVFEDVVIETTRNWSCTPATYQGQAAQVTTTQRLTFKLS